MKDKQDTNKEIENDLQKFALLEEKSNFLGRFNSTQPWGLLYNAIQ